MRWQGKEGREEGRGHKGTRNDRDRGGEIYLARSRAVAILGGGGGGGGGGQAPPVQIRVGNLKVRVRACMCTRKRGSASTHGRLAVLAGTSKVLNITIVDHEHS